MKLFFIRHGQTDWNVSKKIQGSSNTELNSNGIIQAEKLGKELLEGNYNISKIYSSPQKRALETAKILSKITNISYESSEGLKEISFGQWEGLTWNEVKEHYKCEYDEWYINRRYTTPPKGETYHNMLSRVLSTLNDIVKNNSGNVAIVTHSAVIMCLQCYLSNTPFKDMTKFKTKNTSITEVDADLLITNYLKDKNYTTQL